MRMLGANKWRLSSPRGGAREIQSAPGLICATEREEKGGFRRLGAQIVVVAQFQCHASMILAAAVECRQTGSLRDYTVLRMHHIRIFLQN